MKTHTNQKVVHRDSVYHHSYTQQVSQNVFINKDFFEFSRYTQA